MRRINLRGRLAAILAAIPLLSACAIGNGYTEVRKVDAASPPLLVAVTEATIKPGGRPAFMADTRRVNAAMAEQPGLIGYALRVEPFGTKAWTLSVWQDEESLKAFVRSDAHRAAMRGSRDLLVSTTFAKEWVDPSMLPVRWQVALELLKREGYAYQ